MQTFNIRGIVVYERFKREESIKSPFYINIIMNCINNGFLFFKYQEDPQDKDFASLGKIKYTLDIKSNINSLGTGRIFTEK